MLDHLKIYYLIIKAYFNPGSDITTQNILCILIPSNYQKYMVIYFLESIYPKSQV